MRRPLRLLLAAAVAPGLLVLAAAAWLATQRAQVQAGAEAYVFGCPLVLMDLTRQQTLLSIGAENTLQRLRRFPDASFRGVVRPNVDTLYTSAFIDMAQGPWLFEMPPNAQRYELMPLLDAWTNVTAAPGTRDSGSAGGRYLLVGPGWQGTVPEGLRLLRSPTRLAWLIGRTPSRRWGDVEDLAPAAVFLASDASKFVNGHILYVDGGMTAGV